MKFLFLFLMVLMVPFVLATDGCFLYQDSSLYCESITQLEAEEECELYDDCSLLDSYVVGSCELRTECQTVLCKSSCQQELAGNCISGVVPTGEETEWCSGGCCSFSGSCSYVSTKWRCEINAKNKGVAEFTYISGQTQNQCSQQCQEGAITGSTQEVSDNTFVLPTEQIFGQKNNKLIIKDFTNSTLPEKKGSFGWMIWFFMFVLLGMGVYYFLIKSGLSFGFNLSGSKTVPNDDADDDQKENVLPNWVQGLHDRLIKKKKRHQHKVKTKKREEMLTEFGVTQHHPKKRNPHFHKLHRIVRHYEINKKDVSENNKKEQKSFVEHLGNKIKQKEEKINEKIAVNNTKRKNKNSIDNLRTLTRKK